jgi:enterochelin esterase-like enzyme
MTDVPYVRHPIDFSRPVRYAHGPDSYRQPGVPRETVLGRVWQSGRVFPGTRRRYWVYVPAQYTASEPASLMVFQDGGLYVDPNGDMRVPIVFDNLIHAGEMPVTLGIFIDPGEPENRNVEYDTFSAAHATFLLTQILPEILDGDVVSDDPARWGIGGGSSGGSCAFTVAWTRPDRFERVLSFLGSFAQIRDGNRYPELIEKTPTKPLRVFLQAATRDLNWDAAAGNWFSANLRVAAALAERGYDVRLVLGDGAHDPNHGGAILPDALRWLWRSTSPGRPQT